MNMNEKKQPIGSLRISKDVIATIVGYAAGEVEGVHSLATLSSNIKGIISQRKILKPVTVALLEDTAIIDIQVILAYGAKIPAVSVAIQEAVKEAVQSMTGIAVSKVNITIAGIDYGAGSAKEATV